MDGAVQLISYISVFNFGLLLEHHHVGEQREAYMEKQPETMKWPQKPIRLCSSHFPCEVWFKFKHWCSIR